MADEEIECKNVTWTVLSKVKGAKRCQAHKMPEALGSRLGAHLNEQWQYAIN
jgi:hypothetical protein